MPVTIFQLNDKTMRNAALRFQLRKDRIAQTQKNIRSKQILQNDTSKRIDKYIKREVQLDGSLGQERKIGIKDDFLHCEFLEKGMISSHSVGIIEHEILNLKGTGFLIAPNIMITNHHVLPTKEVANSAQFRLGFERDTIRVIPSPNQNTHTFDPDQFFITNEELDFTLVYLDTNDKLPWLPLIKTQGKILVGDSVNLVQHPNGEEKKIVLHNSYLLDLQDGVDDEMYCWYSSDTEVGSSGCPVSNNRWEVIALHHKSIPKINSNYEILDINGKTMTRDRYLSEPHMIHWIANEGIRTSRIVFALEKVQKNSGNPFLTKILGLWKSRKARKPGLKFGWS